jgi:hypothetical protein
MREKTTLLKESLPFTEYQFTEPVYYDPKTRNGNISLIKMLLGSMCPIFPALINYERLATPESVW